MKCRFPLWFLLWLLIMMWLGFFSRTINNDAPGTANGGDNFQKHARHSEERR